MMDSAAVAPERLLFSFAVLLFLPVQVHVQNPTYDSTMPNTIAALSGSCLQIPCAFDAPDNMLKNAESIFGCWLKGNHAFLQHNSLVVFNGSTNRIKGFNHLEILGNLSQSKCTTVFYDIMNNHTDKYYFRVEIKNPIQSDRYWNYTYQNYPVYISVYDVPELPIFIPTDLKEVMEGTTVNLSCSAEAPCPKQPPTISWSNIPESADITTQLQEKPDKTQSVVSYVTFKASYKDHRKNITCAATYPRNTPDVSTVKSTVTLKVLFPPKETHFTFTSVGNNVTLTCKSKASPATDLNYTWYKFGVEMPIAWEKKIHLTESQHQTGSYYCIAQNKYGKQSSEEAWRTAKGPFMNMFAGCVGGIMAVLILCAIVVCIRTITFNKPSDNRKDPSGWFNGTDYVNIAGDMMNKWIISDDDTLIVYYEETDISKQQNFCLTETLFKDDKCTEIEYTQMC
ncbi:myelin-associated glycoprotein-like isoform X1 [Puntigrus tetrazona]|uniref:myelin-associated glycoprotein-like isoform X1 n=1 Tax=Puntigrus tetrazona TaxID=1606681 RepID=UPI001C89B508|nr:myelin-associated glycoprotein-like isoform X1 [Puntigrus tetrazona]